MHSAISRRRALLGLFAVPWFGQSKVAPQAPSHPLVFLSRELQPLLFALGDERVSVDGLETRWRKWCATRQIHPQPPHAGR
jgi:hypothetical protein